MFGHLKNDELLLLMEGSDLPANRRAHLDACARCTAARKSLQAVQSEFSTLDDDIVEPDWTEFRSSVRDRLLSRSVQRAVAVRRWTGWTGWPIRPAAAFALSLLIVVAATTGAFLWNRTSAPAVITEDPLRQMVAESSDFELEKAVWSQSTVFDELSQLGDTDVEKFRQMLQSELK